MSRRPSRLPAALSSLLAAALLGTTLGVLPPSGPAAAGPDTSLVVGTYNIRAGVSVSTFRTAVELFKKRVDVAGLQEIGLNEKNILLKADQHWGYHRPRELQQNPVIWRRSQFDFLGAPDREPYYRIAESRTVERTGGGLETKRPSWATVVRLRHRGTGQRISVVNVHLMSGATQRGRAHPDRPRRFALLKEQIGGLVRVVKAERAAGYLVHAVGDFNVDFRTDVRVRHRRLPFRRFRAIGFRSMWQGYDTSRPGTHSRSYLDQVFSAARPARRTVALDIKGSDHRPAIATYTLPVAPGYSPKQGTVGFASDQETGTECDYITQAKRVPLRFALTGDLSVGYARAEVVDGTARQGVDFTVDLTSVFDTDPSRNEVVVTVLPDDRPEGQEEFAIRLLDPVHTTLIRATVRGVIADDDGGSDRVPAACKG